MDKGQTISIAVLVVAAVIIAAAGAAVISSNNMTTTSYVGEWNEDWSEYTKGDGENGTGYFDIDLKISGVKDGLFYGVYSDTEDHAVSGSINGDLIEFSLLTDEGVNCDASGRFIDSATLVMSVLYMYPDDGKDNNISISAALGRDGASVDKSRLSMVDVGNKSYHFDSTRYLYNGETFSVDADIAFGEQIGGTATYTWTCPYNSATGVASFLYGSAQGYDEESLGFIAIEDGSKTVIKIKGDECIEANMMYMGDSFGVSRETTGTETYGYPGLTGTYWELGSYKTMDVDGTSGTVEGYAAFEIDLSDSGLYCGSFYIGDSRATADTYELVGYSIPASSDGAYSILMIANDNGEIKAILDMTYAEGSGNMTFSMNLSGRTMAAAGSFSKSSILEGTWSMQWADEISNNLELGSGYTVDLTISETNDGMFSGTWSSLHGTDKITGLIEGDFITFEYSSEGNIPLFIRTEGYFLDFNTLAVAQVVELVGTDSVIARSIMMGYDGAKVDKSEWTVPDIGAGSTFVVVDGAFVSYSSSVPENYAGTTLTVVEQKGMTALMKIEHGAEVYDVAASFRYASDPTRPLNGLSVFDDGTKGFMKIYAADSIIRHMGLWWESGASMAFNENYGASPSTVSTGLEGTTWAAGGTSILTTDGRYLTGPGMTLTFDAVFDTDVVDNLLYGTAVIGGEGCIFAGHIEKYYGDRVFITAGVNIHGNESTIYIEYNIVSGYMSAYLPILEDRSSVNCILIQTQA
jgi:hypothetical protein